VLEAMGVKDPHHGLFIDTMEKAYLRGQEPQALKDLVYRWFGKRSPDFTEVCKPYWDRLVVKLAQETVDAGKITHSAKGKLLKNPRFDPAVKPLIRPLASRNTKLLAERMSFPGMSLRFVPDEVLVEYATMDPVYTLQLARLL